MFLPAFQRKRIEAVTIWFQQDEAAPLTTGDVIV